MTSVHRSALRRACAGLLVAASLLCALQARAHTRSLSYSTWALDAQGANVTLSMAQLELTRLPWGPVWGTQLDPNLAAYLSEGLRLLAGAKFGVLPRPAPGILLGLEVLPQPVALQFEASFWGRQEHTNDAGQGVFWLSSASFRPCYDLRAGSVAVLPCGAVELQAVAARGVNLDVAESRLVWLLGVGGGSELRLNITPSSALVLNGWLLAPTKRTTFEINGEANHRPASVYGWLSLGASFRLVP